MIQTPLLSVLNKSLFAVSKISNIPVSDVITRVPHGLCVMLFKDKNELENYFSQRDVTDPENFEILRTNSIYDRMQEFAGLGFAGCFLFGYGPIFFGNRISEYSTEMPSIGFYWDKELEQRVCFGVAGTIKYPQEPKLWVNHRRSDAMLRNRVRVNDIAPINPKNTFYSILARQDIDGNSEFHPELQHSFNFKFANGSPLREDLLFSEGAFVVFSEKEFAEKFWNSQSDNAKQMNGVIAVPNIFEFVTWLHKTTFPFPLNIGLNPNLPRFLQGYFFIRENNCYLRMVHGVYHISDQLEIEEARDDYYVPDDNVDESPEIAPFEMNLASTIKNPISRVVGRSTSKIPDAEAETLVDDEIENSIFKGAIDWSVPLEENSIGANSFLVFGYNKISGDAFSNDGQEPPPNIFSDIFEACTFFYHLLFPLDYELNLDGYSTCTSQVPGSKNMEHENFFLEEKRKGISKLMKDILVSGYKPEHSLFLEKFINKYSPNLHIDSCGYLADLSIYDDSTFTDYIDENKNERETIVPSIYKKLAKHYRAAKTRETLKNDLSEEVQKKLSIWLGNSISKLSPDSLLMLQTAILEYENAGKNARYDYSGISMKLSKVFEKELKQLVFIEWRNKLSQSSSYKALTYEGSEDFTLRVTVDWINKKRKVDLGNMRYILERVKSKPDHPALISLSDFIQELPNKEFLLSEMLQSLIMDISSKYRNGGVHDSMVSYEICSEAFQKILIEPNSALKLLFYDGQTTWQNREIG